MQQETDYKALLIQFIAEKIDPILKERPAQTVVLDFDFYNCTESIHLSDSGLPRLEKITSVKELKELQAKFRQEIYQKISEKIDDLVEQHAWTPWEYEQYLPSVPYEGPMFVEPFYLSDLAAYDGADIKSEDIREMWEETDINPIELLREMKKCKSSLETLSPDRLIVLSALTDTASIWNDDRYGHETEKDIFKKLVEIRASLEHLGEENSRKMLEQALKERLEKEEKEKQGLLDKLKNFEALKKSKSDAARKTAEIRRQKGIKAVAIYVKEHGERIPTPNQLMTWQPKPESQKELDAYGIKSLPKKPETAKDWISNYQETVP